MIARARPPTGGGLAAPIQAEKDRAKSGGATIEDGVYTGLIQPVYDVFDGAGVWSDVVFFGVAGVRDVLSGSVSKLYDQSGNQNDVTQSTSSQRPTDTTNATFGGRVVSDFDGTDDEITTNITDRQLPKTRLVHFSTDNATKFQDVFAGKNNGGNLGVDSSGSFFCFGGVKLLGGAVSKNTAYTLAGKFDGSSSVLRVDKSDLANGNPGQNKIKSINLGKQRLDGPIAVTIDLNGKISDNVLDGITNQITSYYT